MMPPSRGAAVPQAVLCSMLAIASQQPRGALSVPRAARGYSHGSVTPIDESIPLPPPALRVDAGWAIVFPMLPNCFEVRGAEVVREEIRLATNLTLSLRAERADELGSAEHAIYVGATKRLASTGRLVSHPLAPEETLYFADGGSLFVVGDDTGAPLRGNSSRSSCTSRLGDLPDCVGVMPTYSTCRPGTLVATYRFCREVLGVRWLWPGDDGAARRPGFRSVELRPQMQVRSAPGISMRQIRPNPLEQIPEHEIAADIPGIFDSETAERIRFAEHDWYIKMGLGSSQSTPPWGQAFMDWWHMYNQSHPEYFALQRDGHRGPDVADWGNGKQMWTKMCVSQPALHDQIVKNFVNHTLLEGVGNHSLGVSACEDDFDAGYCTCSKCRSWDVSTVGNSSTGRLSDRYARFWVSVYKALAEAGHPDKWVSGYAYASYTDPPVATKLEGNILILSVGFGDYPALDNETLKQRNSWQGWHNAGAKAMALRPNSLWDGYSSAPYVIGQQLTNDLVFTAQHGLAATDFDSNVAHYQAAGPTYYLLARALWDPAKANVSTLLTEYYSGYGGAADDMRNYFGYWEKFTTDTFTSSRVRTRIARLNADPDTGSGRAFFILIPELYSEAVIKPAMVLLSKAATSCAHDEAACSKVQKAKTYIEYLRLLRAAVNATNVARVASKEDVRAGLWTQTVDASAMVANGQALTVLAKKLQGQMVVNIFYTMAKATERGDLFGLAAAHDAPPAWSGTQQPLFLLPTQHWSLRFDPHNVGDKGPTTDRWYSNGSSMVGWTPLRGPHTRKWSDVVEMGAPYAGVGWYKAEVTLRGSLPGRGPWVLASASTPVNELRLWIDGAELTGGCDTASMCSRGWQLDLQEHAVSRGTHNVVVRVNATANGGMTRRLYIVGSGL